MFYRNHLMFLHYMSKPIISRHGMHTSKPTRILSNVFLKLIEEYIFAICIFVLLFAVKQKFVAIENIKINVSSPIATQR